MNDFIDEVNCLYEIYGPIKISGRPCGLSGSTQVDSEVGDDHAALTDSPVSFLAELQVATEILGVKISKKDTFISSRYMNLAEDYLLMPDNWSELWYTQSLHKNRDIPFLDLPKVRAILPVVSQRTKFSDTVEGKIKLLSNSTRFSNKLTGDICGLALACQTVMLSVMNCKKFPYLPGYLGGMDCAIPGIGDEIELARAISRYKSGNYSSLIYTIASNVKSLSTGDRSALPFLSRCNEVVTSWRTWYTRFDRYLPSISGVLPSDYIQYQIGRLGENPEWTLAATRLLGLKAVVGETEVLVRFQMNEVTKLLLSAQSTDELKEILSSQREEMRSHTIFSNSWKSDFNTVIHGTVAQTYDINDLKVLLELSSPGERLLRTTLANEIIYERNALDSAYAGGPMQVDLHLRKGRLKLPTRLDYHVDEESNTRIEDLLNWLRKPEGLPPSPLLDDDPLLVKSFENFVVEQRLHNMTQLPLCLLFSEDKKLAALMNRRTGFPVALVSPTAIIDGRRDAVVNQALVNHPTCILHVLVDNGSLDSIVNQRVHPAVSNRMVFREAFDKASLSARRLIMRSENRDQTLYREKHFDYTNLLPNTGRARTRAGFGLPRNWRMKR
jgi:hypothetical protein